MKSIKINSALRIITFLLVILCAKSNVFSQPANDDCSGAFEVIISNSEENVVLTNGDTRGATASSIPYNVCSTTCYTDDIFFKFTTPAQIDTPGIVIRAYFDNTIISTDVTAIGMALYASCNTSEVSLLCFSSNLPEDDRFEISGLCLLSNHTYFIRVWSTGGDSATEGTLRLGIYPGKPEEPFLWWETFDGGTTINGWTTFGTCRDGDLNNNAFFKYLPKGLIDSGSYAAPGTGIISRSFCNGAVGVDSDYNDSSGIGESGSGKCPTPGTKYLVSPVLYSGGWHVAGLTLTWTQAIRQFQSTYFISCRMRDEGLDWTDWTDFQVNTEFPRFSNSYAHDIQRHFLPDAAGHDSIQIRFIYNDSYYYWAIDDVKIIITECNNIGVQSNFFAIAPFAQIPSNQVYPFCASADIYNAGICPQTHVVLNHTVKNLETQQEVYNEDLLYGNVNSLSSEENRLFPDLIELPKVQASYKATYTLRQDSIDFDSSNNMIEYQYTVGGDIFALEDGFTRSVSVNSALYLAGAPLSYAYGNYFRPVTDVELLEVVWGVNNPPDMEGKTVSVFLIQWTDINSNQIAEYSERNFIGFGEYKFTGNEEYNVMLHTDLDNFSNPGEQVVLKAGFGYMVIIEYVAKTSAYPQFFMLASEARDYTAQQVAMDSAVAYGLAQEPIYFSVLGFSPDGDITNIDYEVKELDENDNRLFFGNNIVPLVRMVFAYPDTSINTKDELPLNNLISAYPNPVADEIHVKMEFPKPYRDFQIRLINNIGQTVFTKTIQSIITNHIETINVSSLAVGNYMLQVETLDGQRSLPVIIVR